MSFCGARLKGDVSRASVNRGLGPVTGVVVNSSCLGYQSLTAHCSLIAAAVTGACITHLSKRLSSIHPLSAESQHHSLTTHIFTCSQTPFTRRACTLTHTHAAHIYRHRSHYGDKSCLSWLPSVSHDVVCCTSQTPPSSAFHRWICGVSKGLVWWPWLQDSVDSNPPPWSGSRTDTRFTGFEVLRRHASKKGVRLIIAAWLSLIH